MASSPVEYGGEMLTREEAISRLTGGMLTRLPQSLWEQDPASVQGQLYSAVAAELATWLDAWAVTRDCTLLQRADGIDLDVLLNDYALKRYNRRPDAYARQLARQILWTPKGTLFSEQEVSQLLVDAPQLLGRSGRHQPHWWVAVCAPVTMPRTYWQLGSVLGEVWYLSLEENDVILSTSPPPGANMTPWPDGYTPLLGGPPPFAGGRDDVATLFWLQVRDQTRQLWYLTIGAGGCVALSLTPPPYVPGTSQPLQLLDGYGEVWGVTMDAETVSLTIMPLTTPLRSPSYWRLRDTDGTDVLLAVSHGTLALRDPPAPIAWQDVTPGGVPLDWFTVTRTTPAATRYVTVSPTGMLTLTDILPAGTGTAEPMILRDRHGGAFWDVGLDLTALALALTPIDEPPMVSGAPVVLLDPGHVGQYLTLHDQAAVPWYLWHDLTAFAVSDQAPLTLHDATPPGGPFTWWRLQALRGEASAVFPATGGCLAVGRPAPPGTGTATPQALGDKGGRLWHDGIAPDGSLGLSDWPPLDFAQAATCLILNDEEGGRWFWRIDPQTSEVTISTVLNPDTIPWQRVGELGWLRFDDPSGALPWYAMADEYHEACVRQAPSLAQPWGLEAHACPLIDASGRRWLLTMEVDGSLSPLPQPAEDIPGLRPTLYVRDCAEALRHVEAGGSLTTLWIE